jgi:hypothetical protein
MKLKSFFLLHEAVQIFLWVLKDMSKSWQHIHTFSSINVSMITSKIAVHNFPNNNLIPFNDWSFDRSID